MVSEKQLEKALSDYEEALKFTEKTHISDLRRIDGIKGVTENFDDFFYEYIYVICASGFRAKVAARLTPLLHGCNGDMNEMKKHFKNEAKLKAIAEVYKMKSEWSQLRESFKTPEDLEKLPRIGPIVKYHLARNIGVISVAKPDKHMIRWAEELTGKGTEEQVFNIIDALASKLDKRKGTVDFALWVWLSHNKGQENEDCCYGKLALR